MSIKKLWKSFKCSLLCCCKSKCSINENENEIIK